jgi:hypothetical protein
VDEVVSGFDGPWKGLQTCCIEKVRFHEVQAGFIFPEMAYGKAPTVSNDGGDLMVGIQQGADQP